MGLRLSGETAYQGLPKSKEPISTPRVPARYAAVTLDDGQTVPARVVGLDLALNTALLKVDQPAETVLIPPLGDSSRVRVGQRAILIGNPMGLNQTMGLGIISSVSPLLTTRKPLDPEIVFETDIAIKSPQYAGSPVLNWQGEVIAITNVITDRRQNLSFLLPINLVKEILPELAAKGWVARPSLGIRGLIIGGKVLELFKLPLMPGFLVEQVDERGPAALAPPLLEAIPNGGLETLPGVATLQGLGPQPMLLDSLDKYLLARDLARKRHKYFIGVLDPCAAIEFTSGCPWDCTWTF
jgi:hypothetical protein